MLSKFIGTAILVTSVISCGHLQRSRNSGYSPDAPSISDSKKSLDSEKDYKTAYELGINPNSEISETDANRITDRLRLKNLERTLNSKKEKEQYSRVLPWLKNDSEKIEFLSIRSLEGRHQWANDNGIWDRAKKTQEDMKEVVSSQDIAIGMQQDSVRKSWGEPQGIEVSGNPIYKNERWKYQRFVSTPDGYKKETRLVYFEGGRVVGWDTE